MYCAAIQLLFVHVVASRTAWRVGLNPVVASRTAALVSPLPRPTSASGILLSIRSPLQRRRAALAALGMLPLGLVQCVQAVCVCPAGLNSCVCDGSPAPIDSVASARPATRLDAAGRDREQTKREIKELREDLEASPQSRTRRASRDTNALTATVRPTPDRTSSSVDTTSFIGSLTGLGTQNFGDQDVEQAQERFAAIVAATVEKRESKLGFELDKEDIINIERVLRNKYCGPNGLIGPC